MKDIYPMFPAHCPNCSAIFKSGIALNVGTTVRRSIAVCPRCGTEAPVVEGTVELLGGVVTLVQAMDFNQQKLDELTATIDEVKTRQITLEGAYRKLEKSHEPTGEVIRKWGQLGINALAALGVVATLVYSAHVQNTNAPLMEKAIEALDHYLTTGSQVDSRNQGLVLSQSVDLSFGQEYKSINDLFASHVELHYGDVNERASKGAQKENRKSRRRKASRNRRGSRK